MTYSHSAYPASPRNNSGEPDSSLGSHGYSENDLQQIEKFASIYLKISDMAVIGKPKRGCPLRPKFV